MSTVKETVEGKKEEIEEPQEILQEINSEEKTPEEVQEETISEEEQVEQKEALKLYRDLKGPKGVQTLEGIAKSVGLELKGTKEEKKEQVKNVSEIFQAHLGEDYKFLAQRIGSALEQVIAEKLLPEVNSAKQSSVEIAVNGHLKDIYDEESIPKIERSSLRDKMDKLSIDLPFSGTGDMRVYLKRLYNIVIREDIKTRQRIEKINRNAEEEDYISAVGSTTERFVKGPKNPSLRQSIEAAARGERWE